MRKFLLISGLLVSISWAQASDTSAVFRYMRVETERDSIRYAPYDVRSFDPVRERSSFEALMPLTNFCTYGSTTDIDATIRSLRELDSNAAGAIGFLRKAGMLKTAMGRVHRDGDPYNCSWYRYRFYTRDGFRLDAVYNRNQLNDHDGP